MALLEPGDGVFTVYDFALDRLTATDDVPPAVTWQLVIDNTEPGELDKIGYQAEITYGHRDVAERAWQRAAEAGRTNAMFNLGIVLYERGDLTEAETWWRRAVENGDTSAMHNLGTLLHERGNLTEAETWYRRAADTSNTTAMCNLGALLYERGNLTEAETWYRRAADNGDTTALCNLRILLELQGKLLEAKTLCRWTADVFLPNLGVLLQRWKSLCSSAGTSPRPRPATEGPPTSATPPP